MKLLSARLLAGSLLLVFSLPLVATHTWGNYHWARTSNPFTIKLGDNVGSAWDSSLKIASMDWTDSMVLDTPIVAGGANARNCRPTSGRVEVCNSTYGSTGWLGIAQIWASGSHITQGIVKLNDTYYNTARYNTPEWRNFVTCQEIGHTLGLGHQDENFSNDNFGSCMDYTNSPGTNQHPNFHDYELLEEIYKHGDSTTTVAPMPSAMGQIDFDGPRQWGRLVKSSRNGLHEMYELDFGQGHKVITFVTWVDGEARGRGRDHE